MAEPGTTREGPSINTTVANRTEDTTPPPAAIELAPPDYCDPVIEAYKKDVDRTLLRENLKLTVEERLRKAENFHEAVEEWREAGRQARMKAREEGRT